MRKPSTEILLFLVSALIGSLFAGCGYTTGSLLPTKFRTIYIDPFKNKIDIGREVTETQRYTLYRPGLENDVTSAVVQRFVFDGNLAMAKKENADLILSGSVVSYRQDALRYDRNDNVEEYRINIDVDIELKDASSGTLMWKETSFTGDATYKTTGRFATSEDTARQEAVDDLARRIVERTVENW